jgi:plastocyanin
MISGRFSLLRRATVAALCLTAGSYASTAAADPNKVTIQNFMFAPASLTVKAGSKVTWANLDQEPHTVVSDTGLFRSGALDTNESFAFKFDKPGTYHFLCTIHPQMVGTILVE